MGQKYFFAQQEFREENISDGGHTVLVRSRTVQLSPVMLFSVHLSDKKPGSCPHIVHPSEPSIGQRPSEPGLDPGQTSPNSLLPK